MQKKFFKKCHNFMKLLFLQLHMVVMQMLFLIIWIQIMNLFHIDFSEIIVFRQKKEFTSKILEFLKEGISKILLLLTTLVILMGIKSQMVFFVKITVSITQNTELL